MGASLSVVDKIFGHVDASNKKSLNILDIGCQNLYLAEASKIEEFILRWNPKVNIKNVSEYACMIEAGSAIDPVVGGLNGAWLGDLLTKAGHEYLSFDIFDGTNVFLFDLNFDLPNSEFLGKFELVTNFGTTEHVLNQYLSFKTIHDLTCIGGVIYHDLPMGGYHDHGYFNYNPKFFEQIAVANNYEILFFRFSSNAPKFVLPAESMIEHGYSSSGWIDVGIEFIFRKTSSNPFTMPLDTTTSLGLNPAVLEKNTTKYVGSLDAVQSGGDMAAVRAALGTVRRINDIQSISGWDLQRELGRRYFERLKRMISL